MPMPFRIDMTFTYFKPEAENQLLIRPNPGDLKTGKCHLRGKKKRERGRREVHMLRLVSIKPPSAGADGRLQPSAGAVH